MGNDGHRLVFGDDGSEHADVAWLWINNQTWPGWKLDILTCAPPPPGPPLPPERSAPHPWDPDRPRRPFAEAAFAAHRHLLAEADPRVVLTEPTGADLVVVGARGHSPLKALHLGSTAEYVVNHAPAPVVVAKRATPVHVVVVTTDGSPHAERAAAALAAMPWLQQVRELTVIGVARPHSPTSDPAITAAVDRAAALLATAPVRPTPIVTTGHVANAILTTADTVRADLIVAGTRGVTGLRRLLLGSTAGAVLRATRASVLLATARD
jgi:nucleotide-binding universal stress UspA family protein